MGYVNSQLFAKSQLYQLYKMIISQCYDQFLSSQAAKKIVNSGLKDMFYILFVNKLYENQKCIPKCSQLFSLSVTLISKSIGMY